MLNRILLWGQKRIEKGSSWILAPFSFIWGVVSFCRNFLYDVKLLHVTKVACPVVSVGNIVAGGTGKTPLVHLLAMQFKDRRIAILSRGYKTEDEPKLLARRIKHAKVYIGKNRVALAKRALEEGAELMILDDGFQHRKLHRDFDLVILHGADPFGKGHFLPWGFLRDHPSRLKQADAVFLNSSYESSNYIHVDIQVNSISDGVKNVAIDGKNVAIFCGIAKPDLFKKTVRQLGANIVHEWILADHEKAEDIERFALVAKTEGADAILCTEKDFVKLSLEDCALPIYFVEISLVVTAGQDCWEKLIAKITQKIDNQTS